MKKAKDFELIDAQGAPVKLSSYWAKGPVLFVFYPGDFTPVCTAQLCDYRDNFGQFQSLGVQIVGISKDAPERHREFAAKHGFKFPLITDAKGEVIQAWGCASKWSFGLPSRAVCLVNGRGEIAWKYVETFAITRRRTDQLVREIREALR